MTEHIFVEKASLENREEMLTFLKAHDDYSLFLLGNYENYGSELTNAPYSGNYKLVRLNGSLVAVFCLSCVGNLLIQSILKEPVFSPILASCLEENIPIKGLLGEWDFCHAFWQFLKDKKIIQEQTFASKEILYQLELLHPDEPSNPCVRLLTAQDFSQWKELIFKNEEERGLPHDLREEQLKQVFIEKCSKKIIWGYFLEERLVSIADLNAKGLDLAQLGGVHTLSNYRRKGYSRAVIDKMLSDLKTLHYLRKLIIFTGEDNIPAQKLYKSLGAKQVGHFALLFGRLNC